MSLDVFAKCDTKLQKLMQIPKRRRYNP